MRRLSAILACSAALGVIMMAPAPTLAATLDLEEVYQFYGAPERPHIVLQMHYHF